MAWSPDGTMLATGATDGTVRLWAPSTGREITKLFHREAEIGSAGPAVTWRPDSTALAIISHTDITIVEVPSGQLARSFSIDSVRFPRAHWSRGSDRIVAVGGRNLVVLDVTTGSPHHFKYPPAAQTATWSPDGQLLALGTSAGVSIYPSPNLFPPSQVLIGPEVEELYATCWSPDGNLIAAGGEADRIWIWDRRSQGIRHIIEAPFEVVEHLEFSADGRLLAARNIKGDVSLWRTDSWTLFSRIPGWSPQRFPASLAFHPSRLHLATLIDDDTAVQIWQIPADALRASPRRTREAARYQNAKVLIVGDSGVGKSGLATVLAGQRFKPTESTHARRVVSFARTRVEEPPDGKITRETLLWDLAGQPGYRLVHQIQMTDAVTALVLFDARSETDPFGDAAYWSQALDQAQTGSSVPLIKYLVAARTDRGGIGISQRRIDEFVTAHGFAGFFRTSAKTGEGVKELAAALRAAIPWDVLPMVSSTRLFTDALAFIEDVRADARAPRVQTMSALFDAFRAKHRAETSEAEFAACLRRLESTDEVDILAFSAIGDRIEPRDHVLVDPSYVDAYASAVVTAAKDEPDGIGHLREADILACRFRMDPAERLKDPSQERLVLVATVEFFVEHDIALRERIEGEDYLVFPSQYTRDAPFPGSQSFGVSYEFAGPVRSIFMTLVVRLAHASEYRDRDFWRDAARYHSIHGGQCIVLFHDLRDGRGRLTVFFEQAPPSEVQQTFLEYVYGHVRDRAPPGSVTRGRAYHCSQCGYRMDEAVVERRLRAGKPTITCPQCDTLSPLHDLLFDERPPPEAVSAQVQQIDEDARGAKLRELATIAIHGKSEAGEYDVFLSYNSHERAAILEVGHHLKDIGLRPWLDRWDLIPGRPWQKEVANVIGRIKSAAVFVGSSGVGPWEDIEIEVLLHEFVRRKARVIPVLLPGAQEQPELPLSLRVFTWVDLRDQPMSLEALRPLIAGILDVRPGDDVLRLVERSLRARAEHAAPRAPARGIVVTLALAHDVSKLGEDDREAIGAQMAQQLGIADSCVKLAGTTQSSIQLELDHRDDVERLFKLVRNRDPGMLAQLARWKADADRLLADNAAIEQALAAGKRA